MSTLTKSQLIAQLEAAHVSYQALEQRCAAAEASVTLLTDEVLSLQAARNERSDVAKPNTQQRRVYEFNPSIAGDFARAAQLAKANKGSVKRMA